MVNGTRINAHDRQSLLATQREDWMAEGACRDLDPNLWFPVGTTGDAAGQIVKAKRICAGCPVREPCLEYALATHQEHGIWGGASEEDRQRMRRTRRRGKVAPEPRECVVCLGLIPDEAPEGAVVCSVGCRGETFCRSCWGFIAKDQPYASLLRHCSPACKQKMARERDRRRRETADA